MAYLLRKHALLRHVYSTLKSQQNESALLFTAFSNWFVCLVLLRMITPN